MWVFAVAHKQKWHWRLIFNSASGVCNHAFLCVHGLGGMGPSRIAYGGGVGASQNVCAEVREGGGVLNIAKNRFEPQIWVQI